MTGKSISPQRSPIPPTSLPSTPVKIPFSERLSRSPIVASESSFKSTSPTTVSVPTSINGRNTLSFFEENVALLEAYQDSRVRGEQEVAITPRSQSADPSEEEASAFVTTSEEQPNFVEAPPEGLMFQMDFEEKTPTPNPKDKTL